MLSLAAAALLFAVAAQAGGDSPSWTIQVDPLTTAIGFVHVQVERTLSSRVSVYVGPHLRLFDGVLEDVNGPYRGVGAEVGVRVYPWGKAPRGPWVLARGVAAYVSTTDGTDATAFGNYASVLAGFTGIVGDWLVLSGGLGGQHFDYTVGGYGPTGWGPAAHSAVGVAF